MTHPDHEQWTTRHGAYADHPLREQLNREVHARPYEVLRPPLRISHLGMFSGHKPESAEADRDAVAQLCRSYGVAPPAKAARNLSTALGPLRLKWERRTELSTYTFFVSETVDDPFSQTALAHIPEDWLAALPGQRLVAAHLVLEPASARERKTEELAALFDHNPIIGSYIAGGSAHAWTDFRFHADGFARFLVRDIDLRERQAGRAVQRLLEIETYRMLAMLAFPRARELLPRLTEIEDHLAALTTRLASGEDSDEHDLLDTLFVQAAHMEQLVNESNYRFKASEAYHALVRRRIRDLREQRIQGFQTIEEFIERRMDPAMRTCQTVLERQESLSERIARTGDLLRTRVDVALEAQNRDLLEAMNRRASMQFRLQETVEGLSVVAISYYLLQLLHYPLKVIQEAGYLEHMAFAKAALVPVALVSIWLIIRNLRHRIARQIQ